MPFSYFFDFCIKVDSGSFGFKQKKKEKRKKKSKMLLKRSVWKKNRRIYQYQLNLFPGCSSLLSWHLANTLLDSDDIG